MSTGKRLAKRSIIGTRVCAPGNDGLFYSGAIQSVKSISDDENLVNADNNTKYIVRFDHCNSSKKYASWKREFNASELVGPGFQPLSNFKLLPGQRIFLTYNGREISGHIVHHDAVLDEVTVSITPPAQEGNTEIKKRVEEIRLLESRKSARLMDQDTDFARLADMAADRKRNSSSTIDVPISASANGSRKRRPSNSQDDVKEDQMNECTAALVLMSLSCSPNSSINGGSWIDQQPVSPSASFSDCCSWRSGTPSPPLSESGVSGVWGSVGTDEGIVMDEDYEDHQPRKRKVISSSMSRILFQCTWPGCMVITTTCDSIENHVRTVHLGPRGDKLVNANGVEQEIDDHEEEFYYTEVELGETYSPPTLSHRDMARPPHEDPEYQKSLGTLPSLTAKPINIPKYVKNSVPWSFCVSHNTTNTPVKQLKLSLSAPPTTIAKRARGEIKKCRKVYGMERRDLWCTQCKWKKACSRFSD